MRHVELHLDAERPAPGRESRNKVQTGPAISYSVRAAPSIRLSILAPCADEASSSPASTMSSSRRSSSAASLQVRIVGRATSRNRTYPRRHAWATFDLVDSRVLSNGIVLATYAS